jgi:hydroxymethylbilane synthase
MELPEGFELAAVLEREDPRDAFVSNEHASLADLPPGAVVGTSSLRRQALVAARYPHLVIKPLRGNLDTRLAKLDRGEYAAIILAAAGLKRLGLPQRIRALLEPEDSLPAAGQGAMAIEIVSSPRSDGVDLRALLAPLNHEATARAVTAERKVSKIFGGSCQIPLAAFATVTGTAMRLRAMVATPDGQRTAQAEVAGSWDHPEFLGEQVSILLEDQDAHAILEACKQEAAQDAAADAVPAPSQGS